MLRGRYPILPITLVLVWFIFPVLCTTAASAVSLTVEDAVRLGLQRDETYLSAEQDLKRASGQIREAWAGGLPRLDLTADYTHTFEKPVMVFEDQSFTIGSANDYRLGLRLTQPLYLGGKVGGALKIAKFYREYAKNKLEQVRNDVVYEITSAFFKARLAEDVVAIYEDAIEQSELNLDVARRLFDQGMAAEFDLLRAEVELANLKPLLIRARNDLTVARLNLMNRLDIQPDEKLELVYQPSEADLDRVLDLESGIDHALKSHPRLLQLEYQEKGYQKAVSIAKADRLPQLYLSSSYEYSGQSDEFAPKGEEWTDQLSASLNLTVPIFDGRAVSGRVMQARADYEQSRLVAKQAREQVVLAVRSAYGDWQEAAASLEGQEKTIEQAEEGLRIANLRYESGVGTQLEVLSAQTANTQAKVNYITALFEYELSIAAFERAAGIEPDISGVGEDE